MSRNKLKLVDVTPKLGILFLQIQQGYMFTHEGCLFLKIPSVTLADYGITYNAYNLSLHKLDCFLDNTSVEEVVARITYERITSTDEL